MIGLTAVVFAGALTLTACGTGTGSSGSVTLKLVAADYGSTPESSSKKYWDSLAKDFTAQHPDIKIDVHVVSWNTIDQKVAAMLDRGDVPDILQTGSYADFAAKGMLYSADDLLPIPVQSDFIPSLADAGDVKGVQYGIPFVSSSRMFFYNTKLFEKAGITTGAPRTWVELKADALKLKAAGVEMPYGLPMGPEEAQAETMMWLLGGEGDYTDQTGSYTLDSEQNIKALQWVKDNLVTPGLAGSDPAKTNRQDVFDKFLKGKVGMLNGHPTLTEAARKAGIKYKLAPIPGKGAALSETLGVADWMMGFKKNGHRDQIGEFLAFAYNQKNTVDFLHKYDLLPVTTTASDAMSEDPSLKPVQPFLQKLSTARLYPLGDPTWGAVSTEMKKKLGKAVTGDPRQVLQQLQTYANHRVTDLKAADAKTKS
ncbi:extracellular solute-binding protein [Wenjunlia tyrosinilytica]|uniref:extracellular solute-binding protein n=1 Tax=Wenjunlia tyrosinilytica TaxID=1544741 RepID=UPI001E2BD951|nr:extracellular solute-binding protein [Wenjunlia tyrosinilytica]